MLAAQMCSMNTVISNKGNFNLASTGPCLFQMGSLIIKVYNLKVSCYFQSVFIIILCNNQLLEWVENELIWVLGHIPVFATMLQKLIPKLKMVQEKILSPSSSDPSSARVLLFTPNSLTGVIFV